MESYCKAADFTADPFIIEALFYNRKNLSDIGDLPDEIHEKKIRGFILYLALYMSFRI